MKVVVDIPNVLHKEKSCSEIMECLGYYLQLLSILSKQLGLCYGLDDVHKFPDPGKYRNDCEHGYVEIEI